MAQTAAPEKSNVPTIVGVASFDGVKNKSVKETTDEYNSYFDRTKGEENVKSRMANYTTVVNNYYNIVTDFYEWGWGQNFHFAPRKDTQTFPESLTLHERYLADQLKLKPDQKVLDVGCGIGGPMREIARFKGCNIVGINNNDYQLERLAIHNKNAGLSGQCSGVKGNFMDLKWENEFDAAYAIEATCHAPDRVGVYRQVAKALKPGALFANYEWCMTDKYDPSNAEHNDIKHGVEVGDALPPILTTHEVLQAVKDAGLEVVFSKDLVDNSPGMIPWYATLDGSWSLSGFRMTWLGRTMTHTMCRVLEFLRIAPEGTVAASQVLMDAADNLVKSGKHEIFTPMFFFLARKPENWK